MTKTTPANHAEIKQHRYITLCHVAGLEGESIQTVWRRVQVVMLAFTKITPYWNTGFSYMKESMERGFIRMNGTKQKQSICFIEGCKKVARSNIGPCEMHYYRKRRTGSYRLNSYQKSRSKKLEYEVLGNGCFIVTSHAELNSGYALIHSQGKRTLVHRFIYTQCFGEIPTGLMVRHKCDNRMCINPEHLLLGTHQDNMDDATERNRFVFGEQHPNQKHSIQLIMNIKNMLKDGYQNYEIAEKLKVKPSLVTDVKLKRSWAWLE